MKVYRDYPPWIFQTGHVLDPQHINDNLDYVVGAAEDVYGRRFTHTPVVYPWHIDSVNGLTDGYSQEARSYRVRAVDTLWVERIYLDGYCISGTATLNVYDVATAMAPTGVTNPVATISTTDDTVIFNQEMQIAAGSTYRFELAGTFTTGRLDMIVHYRSDRFNQSGTDLYATPTFAHFTEESTVGAAAFQAQHDAVATAVADLATDGARCLKPFVVVASNFTSATDADTLRFEIPRIYSSRGTCTIYRIEGYAIYATAGSGGETVTWTLQNSAGTALGLTATCQMSGQTYNTASDSSPTVDTHSSTTGAESLVANDYRITVANSSTKICTRAYCYLWVK